MLRSTIAALLVATSLSGCRGEEGPILSLSTKSVSDDSQPEMKRKEKIRELQTQYVAEQVELQAKYFIELRTLELTYPETYGSGR